MNYHFTAEEYKNLKIAQITSSKRRYQDMYYLGRMALVDWDNLKLTIQIIKEKGVFLHGYVAYSRPLSVLMLAFQLLAAALEKTFKVVLISTDTFKPKKHKSHNLRKLFTLLPDKVTENLAFAQNYSIFIRPAFKNLGIGTKGKREDILDLDSIHLRYESADKHCDIEVTIDQLNEICERSTHMIMELLNLASHKTKKNKQGKDVHSVLKKQKPIVTFYGTQDSEGHILTGLKGVTKFRLSTRVK